MNHVAFVFAISPEHPALAGHFAGNPIVPGVLLLDEVMHHLAAASGRDLACIERVKFNSVLKPGERVDVECNITGQRASFRASVARDAARVLVADGVGIFAPQARP